MGLPGSAAALASANGPGQAVDEAPNPWFDGSWAVDNWSIIQDLSILMRTAGAVLRGRGAY